MLLPLTLFTRIPIHEPDGGINYSCRRPGTLDPSTPRCPVAQPAEFLVARYE